MKLTRQYGDWTRSYHLNLKIIFFGVIMMPLVLCAQEYNYWQEEGYNWDINSTAFELAVKISDPIGNPLGYPKEYQDERYQFNKVYEWCKGNVEYHGSISYTNWSSAPQQLSEIVISS